jgi:16S rRNA (guanine527-N7)-methyltransferase
MDKKIAQYADLVRHWAPRLSLVSRPDLKNLETRHVHDSCSVLPHIPEQGVLYDWGSGAGFPAIIIAIARPNMQVNLVESDGKKCTFLRQVAHDLQLPNVRIWQQRIETLDFSQHTQPCIITARALSSLENLLHYMYLLALPAQSLSLIHI